jgi:hypothetical protein
MSKYFIVDRARFASAKRRNALLADAPDGEKPALVFHVIFCVSVPAAFKVPWTMSSYSPENWTSTPGSIVKVTPDEITMLPMIIYGFPTFVQVQSVDIAPVTFTGPETIAAGGAIDTLVKLSAPPGDILNGVN